MLLGGANECYPYLGGIHEILIVGKTYRDKGDRDGVPSSRERRRQHFRRRRGPPRCSG